MRSLISGLSFLAAATTVAGHSTFQDLWVGKEDQADSCVRMPPSNNPVTDVTSNDIRCNVNGATGVEGVCEAASGQSITVEMHAQPGDRDCSKEAIGGNHYGPVLVYMSKVSDATSADGSDPWFKVSEEGYNDGVWGTDSLNANCGKHEFTLPNLAPGDYLIRAEAIALHVASQEGGAQFYMSCYQVRVTGDGTLTPEGVNFPGAYSATDPGILINIYEPIDNYPIPGPPVISG